MSFLLSLWGRFAMYIVGGLGLLSMLLGLRHSIRKGAKEELSNEIQKRTIERIRLARDAESGVDGLSDDDILTKLREHGWLRD